MKSLRDKVVVVTGGGSGIGRELVRQAAATGARVAFCDVSQAGIDGTLALLPKGTASLARKVDVSRRDEVYAFADDVLKVLGPANVVINNAGVSLSETVEKMSDEDFRWLFDINFWGVFYGTRAFLPQLLGGPEGHVVNISSVFGIIAVPTQSAYNASKFAVRGFTESLRQELEGTRVRVTCVHPGGIRTNIVRNGRHYRDSSGRTTTEEAAERFENVARTSPEDAARTILDGIRDEAPRVLIGKDAYLIDAVQRVLPTGYTKVLAALTALGDRARKRS